MFGLWFMTAIGIFFIGDANHRDAINLDQFPPKIHAEKFIREPENKCTYDYSKPGCQK